VLEATTPPAVCDPDEPVENAPPRGFRFAGTLPLVGDLLGMQADASGLRIGIAGRAFPLDSISPLLEIGPIVRMGGQLTGHASWTARAPRALSGELRIEHGVLDLQRLGMPIREIVLDVLAEGRHAAIRELGFSHGAGRADATGNLNFRVSGNEIVALDLHASAMQLPITREGSVYGYLTAAFGYEGMFRLDGHSGVVNVETARVSVPTESSRDLQTLDANSDVFIAGETRAASLGRGTDYPVDIDYRMQSPVWLRRDDLEVAILSAGHVHYDAAGVAIRGDLHQAARGSWIDIFSKRFYFDRLDMEFDGSVEYNPVLDISAHNESPTAGRIGLTVTGRFLNPEILFSSEQYPAATQSEILALLVLGRREARGAPEQADIAAQAQDAAGALLTGLVAGMGGRYARQQLDTLPLPFVPRLVIEPGAGGGIGRYGIGGTVSAIPRLYVEGAYGTVTTYSGSTASDPSTQRPQDFHGLVEYTISDHWSLSGNVGSSGRVGADVFYQYSP